MIRKRVREKVKTERDIYSFLTHKFLSSIKILNVNVEIYVILFLTLKIVVSSCSEMRNHEKQGFCAIMKNKDLVRILKWDPRPPIQPF